MNNMEVRRSLMFHTYNNITNNDDNADKAIALLLGVLIVFRPILNTVNTFTNSYVVKTPYDTLAAYLLLAVLIINVLPVVIRRTYKLIFVPFWIFIFFCLVSILIYPENQQPIVYYIRNTFLKVFPYLFLGFAINDYQKVFEYFKKMIPFALIFGLGEYLIKILTSQAIPSDNMPFAYFVLPSVILAFYFTFENPKSLNIIFAALGLLLLVSAGTRGPIICLIAYIGIYLLTHLKSTKVIITTIFSTVFLLWWTLSDNMILFLTWLKFIFTKFGVSTRILDHFFANAYLHSASRDILKDAIIDAISKSPVLGYGIFGDRSVLLGIGVYPHNIVLEIICQFGMGLGLIFLISLVYLIIKSYIANRSNIEGEFILILFPLAIIKLFMSGSYLNETFFFLLLGICIKTIYDTRKSIVT